MGARDEFEWGVSAVVQYEAQRLGLTNDNDFIYYMFHFAYNFKPHKVALDIAYFRDRFNGADTTTTTPLLPRPGLGVMGQKIDSVLIMPSWSGSVGPFRGLLQGNVMVGTATGRVAGVTPGTIVDRDYDILAWGLVAYMDVDLGIVRPFVSLIYGSGDDTSTDTKLGGFTLPESDTAGITGTTWFAIFDTSVAIGSNDTACPARVSNVNLGTGSGCTHTGDIPFNDRLTNRTHPGIVTRFSNPGTLLIPVGVRVFPLKGHEIAGWYLYKAVTDTTNLREALGIPISKTQYHELGGLWLWTLNPHFDIRLAGSVVIPGAGFKDIARLADCQGTPCQGDDVALKAEARFRARF